MGDFFLHVLEGSSCFGCHEVEAKSRKSNKFPCKKRKKKNPGPRNILNHSQTDFFISANIMYTGMNSHQLECKLFEGVEGRVRRGVGEGGGLFKTSEVHLHVWRREDILSLSSCCSSSFLNRQGSYTVTLQKVKKKINGGKKKKNQ